MLPNVIYIVLILLLTNSLRVVPLEHSPILGERAQARAQYLCDHDQWSHAGWHESFRGITTGHYGENLARGFKGDPVQVVLAWHASPSHLKNIVNKVYRYTGVGYACDITVQLFTEKLQ